SPNGRFWLLPIEHGEWEISAQRSAIQIRSFTRQLFPLWPIFSADDALDNCRSPTQRVNCTVKKTNRKAKIKTDGAVRCDGRSFVPDGGEQCSESTRRN